MFSHSLFTWGWRQIKSPKHCGLLAEIVENVQNMSRALYRMIKKSLCTYAVQQITPLSQHTSFLSHYLAQSDCLAADRQGQGNTRLTLTPAVILNFNYVIMVSDWNCLKYFCVFFFCTVIIRCTESFWSPCSTPSSEPFQCVPQKYSVTFSCHERLYTSTVLRDAS
jgi:hypothetical protein